MNPYIYLSMHKTWASSNQTNTSMGEVGGRSGHDITPIAGEILAIYSCRESRRGDRKKEGGDKKFSLRV